MEFLLIPVTGRTPACQLFWGWKSVRVKLGPESHGVTRWAGVQWLLLRYPLCKAIGAVLLFVLDSAEWLGSITYIIYLNMSEIPLKSLPRNQGVVFLEFMNTKDFRFMKSAILECSFNYSILS